MRAPEVSMSGVAKPGGKLPDGIALPSPSPQASPGSMGIAWSSSTRLAGTSEPGFTLHDERAGMLAQWTWARADVSEGPYGPAHEPAQGGLSNPLLSDNLVISIDDDAPDRRATAHRQTTQASALPLPGLHKAHHQPEPHAPTQPSGGIDSFSASAAASST